ncbi:hypothetical protein IWW43_001739 [Coemansia sp. RSA 1935]|nr:hypothetical protein IWW43_001739 [Coemansia sp. RSA 1935]
MAQPNNEPRRRYKLRVNFVGADAYDADENVRPYRKLIYLAYATQRIGNVRQGIEEMFTKLYPEDSGHKVMRLRDSLMCDVSDDFLVSDVFDDSPEVYAAMEGLTVQSSATIQPGFGSPNGGTGDRPRITVRPKRKRYTLTPSREDSIESSGIQVEARNGTVNAGYEGMNGSKSARLATGSASRRGTSLESDSPELTPFSPKTLATHDSVLAKRLFTASGARNGSILTTAPLISDIWDNVDVDASVALPPCAVVAATHAESDDMVAATVLLNGFGPPAPALRLQNTEDAVEKNSDSEEDDILQNDSMAVPRTNGRTANPTPKKATAKILLPTRRSARIARSYSGGSSRQYSGSIRFDSEPPTCCDVGRGTTRKRKVAELSDSDESKDETDVESDSSQIPAMLPGSQVKDKQPTPQHSADPVPVAVADVETSETETVDRTATPSVVPEVSDPIDAATQQQTEPVALDSDPESNEENHLSTEKDAAVHPNSDSGSNEEDHSSAEKDVVAQPDSDSRSNEEGHSSTENDVVAQQDIDPRSNEEDHLSTDKDVAPQPDSDEASLEASAPAEPTTPEKRSTRSTSLQTKQADSKPEEDSASEDSAASDSLSESVESDSPAATETELEPLASEASPKPTDAKVAGPYSGEPEVIPSMPESAVVSTEAPLEKLSNDESTSSEEDTSEDESTSEEDDSSEEESSDEESSDDEEAEDKAAADIGVSAEAKKTVVASSSAIKPIASKAGASSSPAIKPIASKTDASAPPVKAVAETASTSSTEASEEDTSEEEDASPVKAVAGTASTSTAEAKEEETADEESSDEESSEEESSSEGEASSSEEESSEESEDESESEAEKEANPTPVAKTPSIGASQPAKKANVEPVKAKSSSQPEKVTTTATVKDAAKDDSSSEDESESEEDSDSSVESDSSLESESEESDSESDKSDADSTAQQKPTKATNVKGAGSATDTPKPPGPVTPPPKVQPAAELRTPTQAGRRSTLASPPLSSSRRKIQLSKPMTPVEESESASEDDSDPPPRKLDKLPILGTPSMSRRTSGVLELAKNQRGGLRDGSGVKSISQIAGAKPYDELRKQMAKVAASRSSSSSQLPTVSFDIKAKDDSSDSESSESDSDSDSDSDSSSEEEMPAKGGAAGKQAKPPAMPGKRPQPIRFAGATKLTASAKARRRTSALLNL